jgi:hypothetical protein
LFVTCVYANFFSYKAKMFQTKRREPLAVDDSFYVRTLLSQQSTPDSVTLSLSLCASNTYKKTHVAYYKTSQPTSSYFF